MSVTAWTGATLQNEVLRLLDEEAADGGSTQLLAEMQTIIGLAESQLETDLQLELFSEENVSETMTLNDNKIAKPDGAIAVREVWMRPVGGTTRTLLIEKTFDYLSAYAPDPAATGTPKYWADVDTTQIMVAPTPSAAYPVVMKITKRLPGLTAGTPTTTTWLSRTYPLPLLYAAAAWAEAFLGADERVGIFDQRYVNAMPPAMREQLMKTRRTYSRPRAQPVAAQEG